MTSIARLFELAERFEKKADAAQAVKLFWVTSTPASANDIMKAQQALVNKGYKLGSTGQKKDGVDGVWGNLSSAALKDFQSKNALPITGHLDDDTAEKLGFNAPAVTETF